MPRGLGDTQALSHHRSSRVGETRGEDTQRLLPEELLTDPTRITVLILWSLKLTFKRTN